MNARRIISISILTVLWTGLLSCDYGRMKDQEAIQTYKAQLPEMSGGAVPVTGGFQSFKAVSPDALRNPLPSTQEVIIRGRENYHEYCLICHGTRFDGNGTVGQSFYPLPTDLKSVYVQRQTDGRLFCTITFGRNRQPALGFLLSETDRWAIVHYLRSLP